jgi:hypothetical protein
MRDAHDITFLLAEVWFVDGTVHVQCDPLGWVTVMNLVDPVS